MRDSQRSALSLFIDLSPSIVMLVALMASVFISLETLVQPTVCLVVLLVGTCFLSLALRRVINRYRLRAMEVEAKKVGGVTYATVCRNTWFSFVHSVIASVLGGAPGLVALYTISPFVFFVAILMWIAWAISMTLLSPVQYVVTPEGVWTRFYGAHSFVAFADLDSIYRDTKTRLVLPSDRGAPIVRFSDYVILSLKPERKLPNENQRKHLTPNRPLEFMAYLPSELIE